jgi:hypothetical protein
LVIAEGFSPSSPIPLTALVKSAHLDVLRCQMGTQSGADGEQDDRGQKKDYESVARASLLLTGLMSKSAQTVKRKAHRLLAVKVRRAFGRAGNFIECFAVATLVLGLFLCSAPAFRIAMKTVTGVESLVVVTQPGGGIGLVAYGVLQNVVAPLMSSRRVFRRLARGRGALFVASPVFLKWQAISSVRSMMWRTRGSEL